MPDPYLPESINPDDLMAGVKRHSFVLLLVVSLAVHLVAIFGTSIGYMRLMRQYKSWHPRLKMKEAVKEQREREEDAKRKAALEKFLKEQEKAKAQEKGAPEKGAPEPKGEPEPGKIPKELKAKSGERPKESSLKLNELDSP
ncbi:MAG: hypothetical protein FJ291_25895 [Planctomycetes bacterium]|nr:hypothetical protein [Planctomycetota bacterium]